MENREKDCKNKLCPLLKSFADKWEANNDNIPKKPLSLKNTLKKPSPKQNKIPIIVQIEEMREGELNVRKLAEESGCQVERDLSLLNTFATKVNLNSLRLLAENKHVKKIWYDHEVRALLDIATPTVQANKLWKKNITGQGVVVAVLDTGIYEHPDLEGRIIAFKDIINNKDTPYDDSGHGTHVAGNIASSGKMSDYSYRAPAPEVNLVGVKVLDKKGAGSISTVLAGIQWCIRNKEKYNIKIMNLSLGTEARNPCSSDLMCRAVEIAWKNGIVVCAAAGNTGPEAKTIDSPGINPTIITVGAINDMGTVSLRDNEVASFSSRGPTIEGNNKPDILAPGVNITSLLAPDSGLDKKAKNSAYITVSGTSMATGICSGVIAQMLQVNNKLTPEQIKEILVKTARKINRLESNIQGAGLIDARKAVSRAKKYKG